MKNTCKRPKLFWFFPLLTCNFLCLVSWFFSLFFFFFPPVTLLECLYPVLIFFLFCFLSWIYNLLWGIHDNADHERHVLQAYCYSLKLIVFTENLLNLYRYSEIPSRPLDLPLQCPHALWSSGFGLRKTKMTLRRLVPRVLRLIWSMNGNVNV